MPTIAEVVREYNNRKNAQYARIGVTNSVGVYRIFVNPSNIKEHFENDGILEFDATDNISTEHVEIVRGVIMDKFTKLEDA